MNDSLETLLYGMLFRRLMEKELEPIEQQYDLQKIDMHLSLIHISELCWMQTTAGMQVQVQDLPTE